MAKTHNEGHGIISHHVSGCGYCRSCIQERCSRQVGKLCSVDKGFVMEGEVYSGPSFLERSYELENVFVKHYAPNHMPDSKGEWSLKENNSELHYGICSKVNQFIYALVCNYNLNNLVNGIS